MQMSKKIYGKTFYVGACSVAQQRRGRNRPRRLSNELRLYIKSEI